MNKSNERTFKLTATALLITLGVVLSRFAIYIPLFGFPSVRFGFAMFPVVVVGALFGGVYGGIAGFIVDILGYIIAPGGVYHPGFTLNAIMTGIIAGYFFTMMKEKVKGISFYWVNNGAIVTIIMASLLYVNKWGISDIESELPIAVSIVAASLLIIIMGVIMIIGNTLSRNKSNGVNEVFGIDKLIFVNIIIYCIVNLTLTPIWINQLYNVPIALSVITRVFKSAIDIPLYVAIQYAILLSLYRSARGVRRWLIKQA